MVFMFIFSFHLSLTICVHKPYHTVLHYIYHTSLSRFNIVWSFSFLSYIYVTVSSIWFCETLSLRMLTHRVLFVFFHPLLPTTHIKWLKILYNLFPHNIFHNKIRLASNCHISKIGIDFFRLRARGVWDKLWPHSTCV